MKPVDQTRFGKPDGNCFIAAMASILEVNLADIPDVYCDEDRWPDCAERLLEWLDKHDLDFMYLDIKDFPKDFYWPKGYHLMGGPGPRGPGHMVVGLDGVMVHDPHPSREGILSVEDYTFFIAKQPQRLIRKPVTEGVTT